MPGGLIVMSKSVVDVGDGELEPAHVERCEETD